MNELNTRLFFKLLAILLVTLLIPVLILGTYANFSSNMYAEKTITNTNINVLTQISETFELILSEIDSISLQYSFDNNVVFYFKQIMSSQELSHPNLVKISDLNANINLSIASKPYIHSMYIYYHNQDGYFLSSRHGLVNIHSFSDNGWFSTFQERSKKVSAWTELRKVKAPVTGTEDSVLTVVRALPIGQVKKDGAILINLDPGYLGKMVKNIEKNMVKYFYVIDNQGEIFISNSTADRTISDTVLEQVRANRSGSYVDRYKGEESLISFHSSKYYNWKYISVVPLHTIFVESHRIRRITFIVSFLSLVAGILLSVIFAQAFYRPVKNMIVMIQRAEKGEDLSNIHVKNRDEYSYIAYNLLQGFLNQRNLQRELAIRAFKLKETELLALQAQINPHFLYNTLETINWKSIHLLGDQNEISGMVLALSDLLRYSIENPDILVTLDEEINHAKNYIELLSVRYRHKFDVKWDIDEKAMGCKTIKLLLQPLVENAVYHGIKEKHVKGRIKVRGRLAGKSVHLTVIDNGKGMEKEMLHKVRSTLADIDHHQYEHIGIFNVNQRLRLQFGSAYGLTIRSKRNTGTAIRICLPGAKTYDSLSSMAFITSSKGMEPI